MMPVASRLWREEQPHHRQNKKCRVTTSDMLDLQKLFIKECKK